MNEIQKNRKRIGKFPTSKFMGKNKQIRTPFQFFKRQKLDKFWDCNVFVKNVSRKGYTSYDFMKQNTSLISIITIICYAFRITSI